jgi:hypothetical protein
MTAQPARSLAADPPGAPETGRVEAMAYAYIRAFLDEDYWTIARIVVALEESGATIQQVAESFGIAGACLLTEAHGGNSHSAAGHATGRQDRKVAVRIRALDRQQ